ncbi:MULTISPECIES: hypothetical protein [Niastella]|uniref:Lipocalin-like domain-containing protein n=1 Tax=Niastella soli TaxID=2821487 RepID=A0ABS3YMS6_9BACT|nr:hypothetical protein [Niastella soli]MBO9199123.1 hypothetical protein [Niastella soli]
MKNYVFALLSIGIILYACNKDDDKKSDDTNAKMQLITTATWKYDTVGLDTDKDGKIDQPIPAIVGGVQACDKDNTITFKSDSTGVLSNGTIKCNSTDPATVAFRWWFKDNGATLYSPDPLFGSSFSGNFKVGELSNTRLRILKDTSFAPYGNFTLVLDLKH